MAAYEWKISGLYRASANDAGRVCEELANSEAGLTPSSLVDASRDEFAPLHSEFEWRDDVAAEEYRKNQAAGIIRNLVIKVVRSNGETVSDRKFVSAPGGQNKYCTLEYALSRDDFNKKLLEDAHRDMLCFIAKYRRVAELSQVCGIMQTILSEPTA